jgi:carboxyl-terminal processing protease
MAKLGGLAKGCGLFAAGVVALIGLALIALLVWVHVGGPPTPLPPPKTAAERTARNLKIFDAAWSDINRHYYDRTFHGQDWTAVRRELRPKAASAKSDAELYILVLMPMTARLHDSHTSADPGNKASFWATVRSASVKEKCPPQPYKIDLGFWPGRSYDPKGVTAVADVSKGSPADRAGLEPGTNIGGWSFTNPACGPSRVSLDILPSANGPERHVSYLLDQEPAETSHAAHILADGVEVLRFNSFDVENGGWLLAKLKSAPPSGVILDLRHNSGGSSSLLEVVADYLEGPGRPLGTWINARGRQAQKSRPPDFFERIIYHDLGGPSAFQYRGPIVVMIGAGSGSAAEVLARSLHCNGRAVLVGERTSGGVGVAHNYQLPDGGELEVTIADFVDPTGQRLEDRGVAPDIFARQTLAAIRSDRDLVVEAADKAMLRARTVNPHS